MRTNKEAKAGDLRERITFMNPSNFSDGFGGFYGSYSAQYTCWASVKEISGARQNSEDQMVIKSSWEFIIRKNPAVTITKSMNIKYNNNTYIIQEINNLNEYDRMVKIICVNRD